MKVDLTLVKIIGFIHFKEYYKNGLKKITKEKNNNRTVGEGEGEVRRGSPQDQDLHPNRRYPEGEVLSSST